MNISILLPYKENFVSNNAGAVSLFVNDITKNSIYQKTTKIFGNTIFKKFLSKNYVNLTFHKKIFFIYRIAKNFCSFFINAIFCNIVNKQRYSSSFIRYKIFFKW